MNIAKENIDELNAVLKLTLGKDDYEPQVMDVLKEHRKKASIPGFRPGKVPMGVIKRMFYKPVLVEEINKIVGEKITEYIQTESLTILGDPLPSDQQKQIDFDDDNITEYEFAFDIGLAPEFDLNYEDIEVPFYNIKADDDIINKQIEQYKAQHGKMEEKDIVEAEEVVTAMFEQVDAEGNVIEGGVLVDEGKMSMKSFKNDEAKNLFVGANVNEIITFNPMKAFENETEVSQLLGIDKENKEAMEADYQVTVAKIEEFKEAEIGQGLFDTVFPDDDVTDEEAFRKLTGEKLEEILQPQAKYKFRIDVKEELLNKFNLTLPEDFLKRWLLAVNKEKDVTKEQLEKDFPHFAKDVQWQILRDKIFAENDLKVEEADVMEMAKRETQYQMQQYGMGGLPEDYLDNFVKEHVMSKEEERRKYYDASSDEKTIEYLLEAVKLDNKEITFTEFEDMFKTDAEAQEVAEQIVEKIEEGDKAEETSEEVKNEEPETEK